MREVGCELEVLLGKPSLLQCVESLFGFTFGATAKAKAKAKAKNGTQETKQKKMIIILIYSHLLYTNNYQESSRVADFTLETTSSHK